MHLSLVLLEMIPPREAPLARASTETTFCIRTIHLGDRLWIVGLHVSIEVVGAGGDMLAPAEEALVSRRGAGGRSVRVESLVRSER